MKIDLEKVDWETEFKNSSSNNAWTTFRDKLTDCIEKFVPEVKANGRKRRIKYDQETLELIRKKHKLYRKWLDTRDDNDYNDYKKVRNKVAKECK